MEVILLFNILYLKQLIQLYYKFRKTINILMRQSQRLQTYSFFSMNEAFRIFAKLSTIDRRNLQLLKNMDNYKNDKGKFYISLKQRPNLYIDLKYLQSFSNHYVFQQNPNQDFKITQYFEFFIELFPLNRIKLVKFSFIIKNYNSTPHQFDSINVLKNIHNQIVEKQQLKIQDSLINEHLQVQQNLRDIPEIYICNSIIGFKLYEIFKEYEYYKRMNNQTYQTLRNQIFSQDISFDLKATKYVFLNSAIIDPQFLGNMVQIKNIQLINTGLRQYCIDRLLQFQNIEKIKIIHQQSPKEKELAKLQIDLKNFKYEMTEDEIINFSKLKQLTIQINNFEKFEKLKRLLIENYLTKFKIKIIIGYKISIRQLIQTYFFPGNFEVQIVAPIFTIFDAKHYFQYSDFQRYQTKAFLELLIEEIQNYKSFEFEFIQFKDLPKSLKNSQLAFRVQKNDKQEGGGQKQSLHVYICNYLQLKAIMGVF